MRIPPRKKDEPLYKWQERIAPLLVGADIETIRGALHDVSVQAYIEGVNARKRAGLK